VSDAIQTVLTVFGGVVGTLLTAWGAVKVAKLSSRAQLKTVEIEQDKVRAGAYSEARESYRELVEDLRKEIAGVRSAQAEDRTRHRAELDEIRETHRQEIADLRKERRENDARLNSRIDEMEARDNLSQRRIQALGAYIRQLIGVLREHEIVPPPAPPGITFD
jgi:tRNA uridine 5-carbamoylmethylation protein Kti12